MDQQKRRASETKADSEALALVSKNNNQFLRVPPPLPYLPSDYRPSPESPRHFLVSNTSTTSLSNVHFDLNQSINGSGKRQRSQSFGHPLAIESASSASSSSVEPTTYQQNFELVPYREWTVIA